MLKGTDCGYTLFSLRIADFPVKIMKSNIFFRLRLPVKKSSIKKREPKIKKPQYGPAKPVPKPVSITLNRVQIEEKFDDDEVFNVKSTSFTTSQGYDILTEKWRKRPAKTIKQKLSLLHDRFRRASLPPPSHYASTEFTRKSVKFESKLIFRGFRYIFLKLFFKINYSSR